MEAVFKAEEEQNLFQKDPINAKLSQISCITTFIKSSRK